MVVSIFFPKPETLGQALIGSEKSRLKDLIRIGVPLGPFKRGIEVYRFHFVRMQGFQE